MDTKQLVSILMAWVIFLLPCVQADTRAGQPGNAQQPPTPQPATQVFFDGSLDPSKPADVYRQLSEHTNPEAALFRGEHGLGHVAVTRLGACCWCLPDRRRHRRRSSEKGSRTLRCSPELGQRTARWQEAGALINQVNKLEPSSREAAALRYAYWTNAKDPLEAQMAEYASSNSIL